MPYISTRGLAPKLSFEEVLLAGLASDGGLYVPESIPTLSADEIAAFKGLPYPELAAKIMLPFMDGFLDYEGLLRLTQKAYANFDDPKVAPLKKFEPGHHILELFHGPTLAFKDFALQLFGHLLDHALAKTGKKVVVLGATSGDTGSAALAGVQGRTNVESYILFPHGRVSEVQRRQMTTLAAKNVHCLAVKGTFDDCQEIVKTLFADGELRSRVPLVAVNSINWARVLAQVVYYFYAAVQLPSPIRFSVPTGNFGDIYAGYIAKRMGLPIEKLIIATNANDILKRCVLANDYSKKGVKPTLSPSMDIQVSSNFERLLFELYDRDSKMIEILMKGFKSTGTMPLSSMAYFELNEIFTAHSCDDAETIATMRDAYQHRAMVVDPHTATGVYAARQELKKSASPMVTLATAHPAKFPDAVYQATGTKPRLPKHLLDLFDRPEKFEVVEKNVRWFREHIR